MRLRKNPATPLAAVVSPTARGTGTAFWLLTRIT
jgi:hypothetical protein